jgi:serine/threonine protein kinase
LAEGGIGLARTPLRETDPTRVGSYQLLARLGAGGMGVVYLASGQDGRPVALKVLRPEMADDAEFRTRFSREVTALTRVRGVCTVRVLDADTTSARPFVVTEYAEGPSLAEYVDSRGPMDPQMLYGLATGLAEALTAIHAAGIVHRDLKPSNVLLTPGGPKVIDFGIAQMLDATAVTRAGMTVGSAGYMAPEQIMGRAGTAADIFSWAVTIAYAASGQPPFGTGTSEVILYRILHETPDIAAVPAALHAQVAAALDKDPHGRPTAPELLSQLTRTAALPSAGSDNPTQTVLAQTWHPAGPAPSASSRRTPPPDTRPPDTRPPDAPRRAGMRRPVLLTLVLAVAILLGAGGAALAFALSGNPSSSQNNASGGASHSPTAPATSAVTNSSAAASSSSSSSSSNSSSTSSTTGTTSPSQPAASTSAPGSSAALPVLTVGSYNGMNPSQIDFSGDSGNVVTGITWASWTTAAATGSGKSDIDSCVPSCAQAPPDFVTTNLVLSDPVNGRFTLITETRNGSTATFTYPNSWPNGAS